MIFQFKVGKFYKWNIGKNYRVFLCLKILNEEKALILNQNGHFNEILMKYWKERVVVDEF